MSELRKLREEQRKKWLEATRIREEREMREMQQKKKEYETKRKEAKRQLDEAKRVKEKNDMWKHEQLHAQIASQAETVEEANLLLTAHQSDFDFPLQKFVEGSLEFYSSPRIQDKYGIVRSADKVRTEALIDHAPFRATTGAPFGATAGSGSYPLTSEEDALLQMAIQESLK